MVISTVAIFQANFPHSLFSIRTDLPPRKGTVTPWGASPPITPTHLTRREGTQGSEELSVHEKISDYPCESNEVRVWKRGAGRACPRPDPRASPCPTQRSGEGRRHILKGRRLQSSRPHCVLGTDGPEDPTGSSAPVGPPPPMPSRAWVVPEGTSLDTGRRCRDVDVSGVGEHDPRDPGRSKGSASQFLRGWARASGTLWVRVRHVTSGPHDGPEVGTTEPER